MNTLQAEKLRDLISFLEKIGASYVKIVSLNDTIDGLNLTVYFVLSEKNARQKA